MKYLKRLFHLHSYEVLENVRVQAIYEGQEIMYQLVIQRCSICGKIKQNKVRI